MSDIKTTKPMAKKPSPRKHEDEGNSDDGDEEGAEELTDTVFIRNLARFDTTQESLKEYIESNFGPTVYCLICKDKETGDSKGTGFVKFKSIETAQQCLEDFEDPDQQTKFFLDGRNLFFLPALSRDKISEVKRAKAPAMETENQDGNLKKKKKKARHNRARAPISQEHTTGGSSPSKPAQNNKKSPKSKSQKTKLNIDNHSQDNVPSKKNKKKAMKQKANLSKNSGGRGPSGGMDAKKNKKKKPNLKDKKKSLSKQHSGKKQRGRH